MEVVSLPLVICGALLAATKLDAAEPATAAGGMVATVHPAATESGVAALRAGGNAVDAAIAAALMLGVVDGHNSGIGGGCFILVHLADGKGAAIDGRETAPAKADRDMFLRDGKPEPDWSQTGPLASGVPGALAAYDLASRSFGRLPLRDALLRAAEIAEKGFVLSEPFAKRLEKLSATFARFDGSRAVFLKADGSTYRPGELFQQADLARTYRSVAEGGLDWFYRGPFARALGDWMADHGGLMTAGDLAGYRPQFRDPLQSTYRGYSIVGFPPPSSGGLHVAQILNILEPFDLRAIHAKDPARFYHVIAEAMKRAFADRAYWLGDPQFAQVPRGLLDKQYAAQLAGQIDLDRAMEVPSHSLPPAADTDHFGRHTTHIAAADSEGNWVAITATINTAFGSKVVVPGTGVVLNNEMDDFSIAPGVPNAAGLVGAEANAVAPGKRPLSSMSPTIVLSDGKPILTLGAAGGPTIISQVVMALVYRIDLDRQLRDAVGGVRVHQQWRPDRLVVQPKMEAALAASLERLGHRIHREDFGVCQAIERLPDGRFLGVHDPRVDGKSAGP
ncbi:MAG: gamma-glutamyltransferase [Pirellulales bacterium]|nr:gamma-glutamyltransferase [Pirellulales bacterium]